MTRDEPRPRYTPDVVLHPGESLLEILKARHMTQAHLARLTGYTEKHVSQVVNGKVPIHAPMAVALEWALDISASFWMNLQTAYDIAKARAEFEETT